MWDINLSIFLLSLLVRLSIADDDDMFIYPTAPGPSDNFIADPVWEIGSVQRVSWTTTLEAYYIALFHQQINPGSGIQIETVHTLHSNGSGDQYFDWTVDTYDTNTAASPVFFFWINPGSSEGFTSHYFNVTNETSTAASTTSSKSASATPTSISSSLKAMSTPSAAPTTGTTAKAPTTSVDSNSDSKTSSNSNSNSNSNYTAVSIGLGVGLGVGVPLILLLGVWIGLKAIKQGRLLERGMGSSTSLANLPDHKAPQPDPGFYRGELMHQPWEVLEAPENRSSLDPFEASAVRSPVELPGDKFPR
ncbi:hypothetical protein BKA80DRAFT_270951 [Phyllosticta citrichinensis]